MKNKIAILLAIILMATQPTIIKAQQTYEIREATLTVYKDGIVHVKMILQVNETEPLITIPSISSKISNIIILDDENIPLDYDLNASNITIYTLGAKSVTIEYDTIELTSKNAGLWTLKLNAPFELDIILPENSTIIYINAIPRQISTMDGRIKITIPPGYCELDYEVTAIPPMDLSITLNPNVGTVIQGESITSTISIITTMGIPSLTSISILNQPQGMEISLNPSSGIPPFTSIMTIKTTANTPPGTYIITIIATSRGTTKTTIYTLTVREYRMPLTYPIIWMIAAIMGVVAIYIIWKYPIRKLKSKVKAKDLTEEEAEIVKFIEEKGGKALEVELRQRFPEIPRTTMWRIIRRLEEKGIVKVRKVGLQNLVELK
ncbi:MAG: hypothetical protein QXI93_02690 [Candidatus Methanomethylicia archaeon]